MKQNGAIATTLFGAGIKGNLADMKIKYFHDTDTALVEFSDGLISETREISENIYVDLDVNSDGLVKSRNLKTAHLYYQ